MILPLAPLVERYGLPVANVLHLGAHLGEEADDYADVGARDVVWVEADPETFRDLAASLVHPGQRAVQALISDVDDDEVTFFVASNPASSSLLSMMLHRDEHPDIVVTGTKMLTTTTVDTLCRREGIDPPDLLVLDLQGAELLALRGAQRTLAHATAVYTEINTAELYDGCPLVEDLDRHLEDFRRVETVLTPHRWGDALYVARHLLRDDVVARSWFSPEKGRVVSAEGGP